MPGSAQNEQRCEGQAASCFSTIRAMRAEIGAALCALARNDGQCFETSILRQEALCCALAETVTSELERLRDGQPPRTHLLVEWLGLERDIRLYEAVLWRSIKTGCALARLHEMYEEQGLRHHFSCET